MNELFLHYVWQHRKYQHEKLVTANGQKIEVIHPGTYNRDAGPDFFNARLMIDGNTWAGNVEIHVDASDWIKHRHHLDPLYSNCILHVVWKHDKEVHGVDGNIIPALQLQGLLEQNFIENYDELMKSRAVISCVEHIGTIEQHEKNWWLERMIVERLESKIKTVKRFLELTNWNWEEAFVIALGRNFGFNINADTFERLIRSVPLHCLLRNRDNLFVLEAILFGQSGLIEDRMEDSYFSLLGKEYEFIRKKYSLTPLDNPGWKYLRLRPSNFPEVRIAQFASLLHRHMPVFSKCMETDNLDHLTSIFCNEVSAYWQTYLSKENSKSGFTGMMGDQSIWLILINTVVPFLFLRGKNEGNVDIGEKALWWLRLLQPEENNIIRVWKSAGWLPENAAHTQALLHLYSEYCTHKKCLLCQIGHTVVSRT